MKNKLFLSILSLCLFNTIYSFETPLDLPPQPPSDEPTFVQVIFKGTSDESPQLPKLVLEFDRSNEIIDLRSHMEQISQHFRSEEIYIYQLGNRITAINCDERTEYNLVVFNKQRMDQLMAELNDHDQVLERTRIEAERTRIETERTRIETERARIETERARTERARIEAERTRIETERARAFKNIAAGYKYKKIFVKIISAGIFASGALGIFFDLTRRKSN